jgi:hypothetical protein
LFYYKDTAYNITADVVKGLNELKTKRTDKIIFNALLARHLFIAQKILPYLSYGRF